MPRWRTLSLADLAHAQSWVIPPGQDDPDRALLGIAPDATVVHIVLANPPDGQGYVWELVATQDEDLYARSRSLFLDPAHLDDTPPAITLDVWAYRVYTPHPQRQVWVEVCWHPTAGVIAREHQPPIMAPDEGAAARTALPRAWKLLRGLERRGRRKGSGAYDTRDTFLTDLTKAIILVRASDRYPSQDRVAPHLGRPSSVRHLQRLFSEHVTRPTGMDWRAFVASR